MAPDLDGESFQLGLVVCGTLPKNQGLPTELAKPHEVSCVTEHVLPQLRFPEHNVGSRRCGESTICMLMPEAAMHKNHRTITRKHNVGLSWKLLAVKTKAKAFPMEEFSNRDLRESIASLDSCHHPAASSLIYNVRQRVTPTA